MNFASKTDEQLQAMFDEARTTRKRYQKLEKDLLNEMNRRGNLPELPNLTYTSSVLSTQKKIDLSRFVNQGHTSGEIIDYVEYLLGGKR